MTLTLIIWILFFAGLVIATLGRPVYAVSLYMLTFFLSPPFWWWGDPIEAFRWNFISGFILLGATVASPSPHISGRLRSIFVVSILMIVNATFVNFALAGNSEASADSYTLLVKFFLLAYMMFRTVRNIGDLQIVMLSMLLGAAYIGYECTFNDRGKIVKNRLEGVGAPGATTANHFASLMVTIMPLVVPFFLAGRTWMKVLVVCIAPLIINVVLLCNSRGAFLAAIASAIIFIYCAPKGVRAKAWKTVAVGAFGVFLLLGDAKIVDRFLSTFTTAEERDRSAQSRFDFAKCGIEMIGDYPLGAGGNGFKKVHGVNYLRKAGASNVARAVHNGYVNEACEWGIQGLAMRLFWFYLTARVGWECLRRPDDEVDLFVRLTQISILSGLSAFLITYLFGDQNSSEWGYWMVALMLAAATLQGNTTQQSLDEDVGDSEMLEVADVDES